MNLKKTLTLIIANYIICFLAMSQTGHTNTGSSSGILGDYSSFYGFFSGSSATSSSNYNSAFGSHSLSSNTTGEYNVAVGTNSLRSNTTASYNTALGLNSLYENTTGTYNTGVGSNSLRFSTTSSYNSALGSHSLYNNTTGDYNVAIGSNSLRSSTTASHNTALGLNTLYENTSGTYNVGVGSNSLRFSTTANNNVSIGYRSGYLNTTGGSNTFIGYHAGYNNTTYSNSTALGNEAAITASNQVRIGNSSVTSIGGQVSWSTLSDSRFKEDIKEDVSGLAFIKELHPVSYTVNQPAINKFLKTKQDINSQIAARSISTIRHTGFLAQEVHKLVQETGYNFNGVVVPQNDEDYYSIRYAEFVVPLVKAVQELSEMIDSQQKLINTLLEQSTENKVLATINGESNTGIELIQNTPNPFSSETKITMKLPSSADQVVLKIYDLKGIEVKSLKVTERGNTEISIKGYELNPGMYIYALIVDNQFISSKKMIITK